MTNDHKWPDDTLSAEQSDAALWANIAVVADQAFASIFEKYHDGVFRKAYSAVRNVCEAEDIMDSVFLELWRSRLRVHFVNGSLWPWLLSTTLYVTLNHQRASWRYRRHLMNASHDLVQEDHAQSVEDALDIHSRVLILEDLVAHLSPDEKEVLRICVVEGKKMSDAATTLHVPEGTVKSRLHRAKARLRVGLCADGTLSTVS